GCVIAAKPSAAQNGVGPALGKARNGVRFESKKSICPNEYAPCPESLLPAKTMPSRDVARALVWLVRYGHDVQHNIPRYSGSVFVLGDFAPAGHAARATSIDSLRAVSARRGEPLDYLQGG